MNRSRFVTTDLGRLHVRCSGAGPPAVLWHSLFVDSQSWGPIERALARDRAVYAIDGPSHGKSDAVKRDFTFAECVAAAEQALEGLGLHEPVDWVGNAWGGHVGIRLAADEQPRLRTLTTIGTPVQALTRREKWMKGWPLVGLYQLVGPNAFIVKQLSDSILGSSGVAAEPNQAAVILDSFRTADRMGMLHAMRSMMLHRSGVSDLLTAIRVPTLVLAARDDMMGWQAAEARQACAAIADCRVEEVAGTGHVSPLLIDCDRIVGLLTEFWSARSRCDSGP
ncbi:alpha/beta fold hydrolase [Mycolicibacterium lutetiense]|uniref:Pimeloyl-ACP methyl ester carboxylesterase n=1 Tax=Mycolicibacterium lutetiense TaxID=1641992 RepID=A0ABS4ZUF3_9MYCO|nr:alpha/beta hydrolase [Mycolicibacterium lutetiense]MBP2452816.1 pimeloyl-ACP methyl ester carboxylesterase [Mycolicibacterium lutetiense]